MTLDDLRRALRLSVKVAKLIGRGVIKRVDDAKKMQRFHTAQVKGPRPRRSSSALPNWSGALGRVWLLSMQPMNVSTRTYKGDLWVVIKPAEDVPGVWVSHCLTLDVMSQGQSSHDAFKHLMGAVFLAVADDLLAGRDPAARGKKTPKEDWEEQALIVRQGERVLLSAEDGGQGAVATNIGLKMTVHIERSTRRSSRSSRVLRSDDEAIPMAVVEETPPAWMIPVASARPVHR